VAILLNDQQVSFEGGKITTYGEVAFKIQKPEGLAAGNLSITWQPATDTVTVNKLQIRRGDKVIDVLANDQTFTVLRRETNLEGAMFDGALTGNIQPEGLQEGDIVDFATTVEHSDPVLKGHAEAILLPWANASVESGHVMFAWPAGKKMEVRQSGDLPQPTRASRGGLDRFELTAAKIEPAIAPNGAPVRFRLGRIAEASDYKSWAEVADLIRPLFEQASVIPATGPLHDEVERIRASTADPKQWAQQTLALVQDRVRYVALLMNEGGYVPEKAETTWSRRYGDCKAKTALLIGILHSLGIEAEPLLVQSKLGDMLPDRLPMVQLFDHVLARARIGGRTYWLDGTRSGDNALDAIETPGFGWGLPLLANASLVRIMPAPLDRPTKERLVDIDATAGIYAPAKVSVREIYRDDAAVALNLIYSQLTSNQRDELLRRTANSYLDDFSVASSSGQFDKDKREFVLKIEGTAKLGWKDGWFFVPTSSISFDPDFDRPAGPLHDAPIEVGFPRFVKDTATVRLPSGLAASQKLDPPVSETLAGVEYRRSETANGDTITVVSSERAIVPEIPYKEALAAKARLKTLSDDDIYLRASSSYRMSAADTKVRLEEAPSSADAYFDRGLMLLNSGNIDAAISDFDASLKLKPNDEWTLANRGVAYSWKEDALAAEKDFTAVEKLNPSNPVLLRGRALIAEHRGEFQRAVELYGKSLAVDPKNDFALGRQAQALHNLGQDDKALAASDQALKLAPGQIDLRVMRANIFMMLGDRDQVAREADAMVQQSPNSDMALVGAAKTYAALGQRDKAMQTFGRALAIKPYAYIYINRAQVRLPSDVAGRTADLDEALKLEPNNPDALAEKARVMASQGKYESAVELLGRIKPDGYPYARVQRGVLMYKAGHAAEGQKLLQAARADAKTPSDLNRICWAKATQDVLLESALQDCREALKSAPDNGAYLDSLGMVLLKLGRLDEALDAYNRAIAKQTGAASLMGRAFVYLRKGDRSHAEADASTARKLSPDIESIFAEYGLKL
jgi:tetratricopeptide (TPR) repeat protein